MLVARNITAGTELHVQDHPPMPEANYGTWIGMLTSVSRTVLVQVDVGDL